MKNITDAPIKVQKRKKEEVFAKANELLLKMGLEGRGAPIHISYPAGNSREYPLRERWL